MGCWHGCGPVHHRSTPRGWYGPVDEDDWCEDVDWLPRRRARTRPDSREMQASSIEERLDRLRDELRRVGAALADLGQQA